jgi:hypothetical protein
MSLSQRLSPEFEAVFPEGKRKSPFRGISIVEEFGFGVGQTIERVLKRNSHDRDQRCPGKQGLCP